MNKPIEIFAAKHNASTVIRVIYGRDVPDGSIGLDVVLSGRIVARYYTPEGVNEWFQSNSKKLLDPWRAAFHKANLSPSDFKRPVPTDITLNVPYFSQRDNRLNPLGTCNVTSYAMVLTYLKASRKMAGRFTQLEDELSTFLAQNGRDRHVHTDLAWMGQQYGVNSRFGVDRTFAQIRAQIRAGFPVIVSGLFTKSGHIIVLKGTKGDDFIANDPYGNAMTRYQASNGESVLYSFDYLWKTVRAQNRDAKWAHFFGPK